MEGEVVRDVVAALLHSRTHAFVGGGDFGDSAVDRGGDVCDVGGQRRIEHQRNIFEAANEDKSKSREDKVGNAAAASTAESNRKIETNTNKMVDFMKEQDDREKAKAGANKPEIAVADLGSWY